MHGEEVFKADDHIRHGELISDLAALTKKHLKSAFGVSTSSPCPTCLSTSPQEV
jgi:hypothetical protein